MILLDSSKVLDKVCHKRLAIKLCAVKLEEKSLLWILDFLCLRSQYVQLFDDSGNRILSSSMHDFSQVPHGTVLGPTLFNIFIDVAPSIISSKSTLCRRLKLLGPAFMPIYRITFNCWVIGLKLGFLNLMLLSPISLTLAN